MVEDHGAKRFAEVSRLSGKWWLSHGRRCFILPGRPRGVSIKKLTITPLMTKLKIK